MRDSKRFAEANCQSGTIEDVKYNGRVIGHTGKKDGKIVLIWNQYELRAKSGMNGDAYSMSVPLVEQLANKGVESVYIFEASEWVEFEDIQDGELLEKDDEMFNEEQENDQRVVYVQPW